MLSILGAWGVAGAEGAAGRDVPGAGVVGVILILFPSCSFGVCAVEEGADWRSLDAGWLNGDRDDEDLAGVEGTSLGPPPEGAGVEFESLARRLLRIWNGRRAYQ